MSRDQPTDLRRGGATTASQRPGSGHPLSDGDRASGPVPEDNRPGHHPEHEQDRPDPDEFVARFRDGLEGGPDEGDETADGPLVIDLPRVAGARPAGVGADRPVDHGANDGPVVVEQPGLRTSVALALPMHLTGLAVRGVARVLHLGGRVAEGLADRVDPR